MHIEKFWLTGNNEEKSRKVLDTFGVRSYQTLVKQEVVTAPGISQEEKFIAAINKLVKNKSSDAS
ncbi:MULTISPECIES: hypothetical protein [Xanthomonas]|uniref:hypothetical protein n=1 Tax=Xanthomonas TaxID=338 RepID=UPI001C4586E3|nr:MULTISPECIES: hypothetical protein [Xanthomonas]MBV6830835.1 hypothetical protein [Xanthomonas campestris pv. viegasii]WDL53928.1 hypothetical protein JH263_18605 [Xanthomonas campestris pv. campestris]